MKMIRNSNFVVHNVLFKHSDASSFGCCLWLLLCYNSVKYLWKRPNGLPSIPGPLQNKFVYPALVLDNICFKSDGGTVVKCFLYHPSFSTYINIATIQKSPIMFKNIFYYGILFYYCFVFLKVFILLEFHKIMSEEYQFEKC